MDYNSPEYTVFRNEAARNDFNNGKLEWLEFLIDAGKFTHRVAPPPTFKEDSSSPVAVILGYYNGNQYLHEQITSILNQSHTNLELYISDDCSDREIDVKNLQLPTSKKKKIHLGVRRKNKGFTLNFLSALANVENTFKYFAFSDQDDVWNYDKVENAVKVLDNLPIDKPSLYCARTTIADDTCKVNLGTSPLFSKPPSFANSLVQNIGGGNTMVLNRAARNLVLKSSARSKVVSHDWWCYQIISGAGGFVYYDKNPCLKYRQHSSNLVGSNNGWGARFLRVKKLLEGRFRNWNDVNIEALLCNKELLTHENQLRLENFDKARKSPLVKRIRLFKCSGIYRQTFLGNLGLFIGILINKV